MNFFNRLEEGLTKEEPPKPEVNPFDQDQQNLPAAVPVEREVSTLLPQEDEETKKAVQTPRKSESVDSKNVIKDLFFGKMAEKHEIVNLSGEKVVQSSESPFF